PAGPVDPPPPPRTAADDFVGAARPAPPAAEEALGWLRYKQVLAKQYEDRVAVGQLLLAQGPAGAGGAAHQLAFQVVGGAGGLPQLPVPADGGFLATPVLAVRAARRAIADNPAHPDGYYALAVALADPYLPLTPSERGVGRITAYRQCLERMPPPADYRPGTYAALPADVAFELARLYLGSPIQGPPDRQGRPTTPVGFVGANVDLAGIRELVGEMVVAQGGRFARRPYQALQGQAVPAGTQVVGPVLYAPDLAQQALARAEEYGAAEAGGAAPAEARQQQLRGMLEFRKLVDGLVLPARERFLTAARGDPKPASRFRQALGQNLIGDAIAVLKELPAGDLAREFGPAAPEMALRLVALELATGRVEDAAADAAGLRGEFDRTAGQDPRPPQIDALRAFLRLLEYQVAWLSGNYLDAARTLDEIDGRRYAVTAYPAPDAVLPFGWPVAAGLGGPDTVAPLVLWYTIRDRARLQARAEVFGQMERSAEFYFRCGYLALLGGDPAAAKAYLAKARRPAPPGWDLPEYTHAPAAQYVRYIDAAAGRAARR
ncbi:MAG: hypothetical protein K2X82_03360, partial [Gemmataceae bacterium]|nr:hypothetical protein [Gemmataceae bacterium]